jgi:nicotinate-nucleotide pyrophosphorylase (carboxylating)
LNLLQRMSGVATATRRMVDAVRAVGTGTRVLDTRKTLPGLRVVEKLAVLMGGGTNHRYGLFDMVMVKDNHITAAGGIPAAVRNVHRFLAAPSTPVHHKSIAIEVETRTIDEVKTALATGQSVTLSPSLSPSVSPARWCSSPAL